MTDDTSYDKYFKSLNSELERLKEIASHCRALGLDPVKEVEIKPGWDIAARVEGLIGIPNIAEKIRAFEQSADTREDLAYKTMLSVLDLPDIESKAKKLELAVRAAVCVLTEGVLVAPTEGISQIKIRENSDGSSYVAVYFAGPIRSAGGTAMALSVVFADLARRKLGISNYRPSDTVIERYVEEIKLYDERCARLQYNPPEQDIRHIVRSCPICIDGDPTEEVEVSVYRNLPDVETNRVRSGIALVICEGIAQKASKVYKVAKKLDLDWDWLEKIIKVPKKGQSLELKPNTAFIEEVVAGRIVLSFPMAKGGFRLRYGRTPLTGIMAKAIHPATMVLTGSFLVLGTQMKVERPGKGCVVTPCDTIEPPIVRLKDGSVEKIDSYVKAQELVRSQQIDKILFLGDLLVSVGDFIKSNHPLIPSGYVEEWYLQLLKEKGVDLTLSDIKSMSYEKARELSLKHSVPINPKFTFHWHDLTVSQICRLRELLLSSSFSHQESSILVCGPSLSELKLLLEELCVCHKVADELEGLLIAEDDFTALIHCLGLEVMGNNLTSLKQLPSEKDLSTVSSMELVNMLSPYTVLKKVGIYIGARMGRPEKAKERIMKPKVECLFPVGNVKNRDALTLYSELKREKGLLKVELANFYCAKCKTYTFFPLCHSCGSEAHETLTCDKCSSIGRSDKCHCGGFRRSYRTKEIDFVALFDRAKNSLREFQISELKCVKGLTSKKKIPERLEKGIIRSYYKLSVFKDGTCRYDGVDVPVTHFRPKDIGIPIEKLRELGYTHDLQNQELVSSDQWLELKVQDIIIPESCADYFLRVSKFLDDLLVYVYNHPPYYRLAKKEDIIGHLFLGLSPHTSAAVLCRVIGFTKARAILAHPYFHAAKRRNADGDEDSIMLLLDALLNFSKEFLPDSRGGTMDSPLVLINNINPHEIDDEVHAMEIVDSYPVTFYEKTLECASPTSEKLLLVKDILNTTKYSGIRFTHDIVNIECPLRSSYVSETNMTSKVFRMMEIEKLLRSVDVIETAIRLINTHFFPDIYGNLRTFAKQKFRCTSCNASYRRIPLIGECWKCGGNIVLTVSRGSIEKYLEISKTLVEEYNLPPYMAQRLRLIEEDIKSIFKGAEATKRQESIFDYM